MRAKRRFKSRLVGAMVQRIVERFDPEKIILVGSHDRGDANPDSDMDLLVVMPIQGSKRETRIAIGVALRELRAHNARYKPRQRAGETPPRWKSFRGL
jgi:predicted nucleotidyltransferase